MTHTSDRRVELRYDPLLTEKVVYSVGPQHPSLPAPVHLIVQCDGELIEHVTPEIGYLHRGVEQLATRRSYSQCAALLSRCEWLAGSNADYLVSAAVEQLAGLEVPERAQWLRMIVLELSRILSHLFWWGQLGLEAGQISTIFWALEQRDYGLDLLESLSGERWHHGWIVPGGVRSEPPEQFYPLLMNYLRALAWRLDEFEDFFSDNAIWVNRSELIGTLEPGFASAHGASGPVLRGSGVDHDLRRDAPYLRYDQVSFDVPTGEYGDVLDRYRVRMQEMRESIRIIDQCVRAVEGTENLPTTVGQAARLPEEGTVEEPSMPRATQASPLQVPKGEAYMAVEGPRGELGLTVISEGGPGPARLHLRSPSLYHLHLLDELCRGYLLADLFVILGSLDIMIGEVDR